MARVIAAASAAGVRDDPSMESTVGYCSATLLNDMGVRGIITAVGGSHTMAALGVGRRGGRIPHRTSTTTGRLDAVGSCKQKREKTGRERGEGGRRQRRTRDKRKERETEEERYTRAIETQMRSLLLSLKLPPPSHLL